MINNQDPHNQTENDETPGAEYPNESESEDQRNGGNGGTSKYHLVKVIYNAISKTLLYPCKDPEKPRVFLLGPTGIYMGGTTIHFGLGIKPGVKLLGLNDKSALRNKLLEKKFLIINELSMVSSDL